MKRKHIHSRTISRLPPEAFIEEYINDKKEDDEGTAKHKKSTSFCSYASHRHETKCD